MRRSIIAKGVAAVLIAAGLMAGTAIPAEAASSGAPSTSRIASDTGWG